MEMIYETIILNNGFMKKVLSIACALVCTFCFTLNVCAQDWKTELIGIISSSNIDVKRSMQQLNEYQERYASVVNDSIEPYISFVKGIVLKADNPDESISHFQNSCNGHQKRLIAITLSPVCIWLSAF